MSKCMTFVDKTIDQKDTCIDISPKDIAEFILEEIILPTVIISDRGCNRIGDFNITEDFCQQFDQKLPDCLKSFEKITVSHLSTSAYREPNLQSGENTDSSLSLLTAKENLDFIFAKCENPAKSDCRLISEELLADNELQIQNGQVRLEINKTEDVSQSFTETARQDYLENNNVTKVEKTECLSERKINKIYVPSNALDPKKDSSISSLVASDLISKSEKSETVRKETCTSGLDGEKDTAEDHDKAKRTLERPFKPFTSEELRQSVLQVWGNGSPNVTGGWEGDMSNQSEEVLRLMEELSSVQVLPDTTADPNRPRACAFAEEDIKKIIKEIEEINFNLNHTNPEECETAYHSDGQGDADLESKSFTVKDPKNSVIFIKETEEVSDNSDSESKSNIKKTKNDMGITPENFRDQKMLPLPEIITQSEDSRKKSFKADTGALQWESHSCKFDTEEEFSSPGPEETSVKPNVPAHSEIHDTDFFYKEKKENATSALDTRKGVYGLPHLEKNNTFKEKNGTLTSKQPDENLKTTECLILSDGKCEILDKSSPGADSEEQNVEIRIKDFEDPEQKHRVKSNPININNSFDVILRNGTLETLQQFELEKEKGNDLSDLMNQESEINGVWSKSSGKSVDALTDSFFPSETQLKGQNQVENDEDSSACGACENSASCHRYAPENRLLCSQKIHSKINFNPANQPQNESVFTDLEEAFIKSTENVIQIINPSESSTDRLSSISISLFNENFAKKISTESLCLTGSDSEKPHASNVVDVAGKDVFQKKTYSGMTTIGPLKSIDYDPKDLSSPDIDFGKMTRITSSRQIAKDFFGTDLKITSSTRRFQENDTQEDSSIVVEGDRIELTSLINRDIASLTKVQRVREVMSYYPKADEDFEDDDSLTRPRLDLKDVESMTNDRYKVADVSLPLRSFELGNDSSEDDKVVIEELDLVLSDNRFNNLSESENDPEKNKINDSEFQNEDQLIIDAAPEKTPFRVASFKLLSSQPSEKTERCSGIQTEEKVRQIPEIGGQDSANQKSVTLTNVFKKSSNKFFHKDADLLSRNSKSLPRDPSKLRVSTSIKSVMDECHSTASTVLKKSRSLMKNTQSILKTLSQSRFNVHDSSRNLSKQKTSPSESDICNVEKNYSLSRKEDSTKTKDLIKSKMEKTFKNFDGTRLPKSESKISQDENDLRLAVRNEENYRVDKIENFQKSLSKSPLMYKSQFVRSQVSIRNNVFENTGNLSISNLPDHPQINAKEQETFSEKEIQPNLKNERECTENTVAEGESSPPPPTFIVMETIEGPLAPQAEPPRRNETETLESVKNSDAFWEIEAVDGVDSETQKSLQATKAACHFTQRGGKCSGKAPKKPKDKNKKFAERFRSFWSSTFGKMKATPKSTDPS